MANPYGAPEISVQDVDRKQQSGESFVWIDVREAEEYSVRIDNPDIVLLPLSKLAAEKLAALPEPVQEKDAEIVVFCHRGLRSAQVVTWLRQQGWTNVLNMEGGIDAWASEIDPLVGTY